MAKKNGANKVTTAIVNETSKDQIVENTNVVEQETPANRATIKAEDAYNLTTDQIDAAIADGHIRWAGGIPRGENKHDGTRESALTDVTIKKDKSPTKRDETQPYEKLEATSDVGMILLSGGKLETAILRGDEKVDPREPADRVKGACDFFNYGRDLEIKRDLRKDLENELSGPDKAIRKMAQAYLDLKMAKNMEQALVKARKAYEEELAASGDDADETEAE